MIDVFILFIVLLLGLSISNLFNALYTGKDKAILKNLWFYHIAFGVIYWVYIVYGPGGDSDGYYYMSREFIFPGWTLFVWSKRSGNLWDVSFKCFPAKLMGFFGLTMVYTLLGYIGILCFYIVFSKHIKYNSFLGKYNLFPLVLFLPNLHFWSAGLGKDTLLFFCIGLFVYSMQQPSLKM